MLTPAPCALPPGGDLFERIQGATTVTERSAAAMFRELVETVAYCHTLGVVHRDIKVRRHSLWNSAVRKRSRTPITCITGCSKSSALRSALS